MCVRVVVFVFWCRTFELQQYNWIEQYTFWDAITASCLSRSALGKIKNWLPLKSWVGIWTELAMQYRKLVWNLNWMTRKGIPSIHPFVCYININRIRIPFLVINNRKLWLNTFHVSKATMNLVFQNVTFITFFSPRTFKTGFFSKQTCILADFAFLEKKKKSFFEFKFLFVLP